MEKIKLRHVEDRELIDFWMLATMVRAVQLGWFPEVHDRYDLKSSPWNVREMNAAIDYLIENDPYGYELIKEE